MSIVINRPHPSGDYAVSVDAFSDTEKVVLGIGPPRTMEFFELSVSEALAVANAIDKAALGASTTDFLAKEITNLSKAITEEKHG